MIPQKHGLHLWKIIYASWSCCDYNSSCFPCKHNITITTSRNFRIALAVGVVSAFVNATIVVGALHVVIDSANDKAPETD